MVRDDYLVVVDEEQELQMGEGLQAGDGSSGVLPGVTGTGRPAEDGGFVRVAGTAGASGEAEDGRLGVITGAPGFGARTGDVLAGGAAGEHGPVPVVGPSPQSLAILDQEVIDVREEHEAQGSETSSVFGERMNGIIGLLDQLGCADSTVTMAVLVEARKRYLVATYVGDPGGMNIQSWAVAQLDRGDYMGIPDAHTAESETIALGQLAHFTTEDLKKSLKTLAQYRALVPPAATGSGVATESTGSRQQQSSGPSAEGSHKISPFGRAAAPQEAYTPGRSPQTSPQLSIPIRDRAATAQEVGNSQDSAQMRCFLKRKRSC